jgi:hypothetical protein
MPNSIRNPAVYGGSIRRNVGTIKPKSKNSAVPSRNKRYDGFNNTKRGA